jgi:hypothetical protein
MSGPELLKPLPLLAGRKAKLLAYRNRSFMTHSGDLLPDFGPMQHLNQAAIPSYKFSVSYSIASSAVESSVVGTLRPRFPIMTRSFLKRSRGTLYCGHKRSGTIGSRLAGKAK